MRKRMFAAVLLAGIVGGLAPLGAGGAQASDPCNPVLGIWTRIGVYTPGPVADASGVSSVGHITYENGNRGCAAGPYTGVTVDTAVIQPGATQALASYWDPRDRAAHGCIHSERGMVSHAGQHGTWCGLWEVKHDLVWGDPYPDSPWVALDPTVPSDQIWATSEGHRSVNYRTLPAYAGV
ncbi:MAG TPA: hypothetical protein VM840_05565 [Actinomycetota bacterium]|nr:hypothetical protein [Actinomycetota bacterium]